MSDKEFDFELEDIIAEFNDYTGPQPDKVIILNMTALREITEAEPKKRGVYTHIHTHTPEVA